MSPDRMRAWLKKRPAGACRLVLSQDQGLGILQVIASWTREEIEDAADPSAGAQDVSVSVLDVAQDHVDSVADACRFSLQWQTDTGRTLTTVTMNISPTDKPRAAEAGGAEPMSAHRLISELLGALQQKDRVLTTSVGVVLSAYERALKMQEQTNTALLRQLVELRAITPVLAETKPEDLEVARLKARALEKLIELGPDVARLAIGAAAEHFGIGMPSAGAAAGNGGGPVDPH
jgi:hypothetical protein